MFKKVGPMNQIGRLVGNDYLTTFRTYGGYVGIEKRLSKLYNYSNYDREYSNYDRENNEDYIEYLI